MVLQSVGCTAGATGGAERQYLPLENSRGLVSFQITPQEPQQRMIVRQKGYLVKHPLDVTTNGHRLFTKSHQDAQQGGSECRAREEILVQGLPHILVRAVEDGGFFHCT